MNRPEPGRRKRSGKEWSQRLNEWNEGSGPQCVTHIWCVCVFVCVCERERREKRERCIDLTLLVWWLEMCLRRCACNGDVIVFRCFLLPCFRHLRLASAQTHRHKHTLTHTHREICGPRIKDLLCKLTPFISLSHKVERVLYVYWHFLLTKDLGCHFFTLIQHLSCPDCF